MSGAVVHSISPIITPLDRARRPLVAALPDHRRHRLRLARYFGTSERFWLNLQNRHELEVERDRLAGTLDRIEPLATA